MCVIKINYGRSLSCILFTRLCKHKYEECDIIIDGRSLLLESTLLNLLDKLVTVKHYFVDRTSINITIISMLHQEVI